MLDDKQLSIVFSKAPILIRLGFLSVDRQHIPRWCGLASLLISNLQTIALLLTNTSLYLPKHNDITSSTIREYLKIFAFADIFSYTNRTSVIICAVMMLVYCLHFIVLLLYLSIKLKKQAVIPDYIQKHWSIMNYFHPLIIFYPIHTFNLRVIQGHRLGTFTNSISAPVMLLFYGNVIINFLLAFLSTRLCYVVIKTKDPLSCKNNIIRTTDILSKTIAPILRIFAKDNEFIQVSIFINGLFDCLRKDFALFYYLPYYYTPTLAISGLFQGATTTLALLSIAAKISSYTSLDLGQYFVHVSWCFLAPVIAKLYYSLLGRILGQIISSPNSTLNLHYALHKRHILKYLFKRRILPLSDARNFNLSYFIYHSVLSQPGSPPKFSVSHPNEFIEDSLNATKAYYSEIMARYPKSHIAKATLAHYYLKKENAYLLANNLIEEVSNDSPSFSLRVSLIMIRFELQKKTFLQYSHRGDVKDNRLDLLYYVQVATLNGQLKQQIKHQVRKQAEFWDNFASSKPDMGILTDLAIKIDQEKKGIQKAWKDLCKIRPSTFYSSPLLYGMYVSFANNDPVEGEKFIEQYHNEILNSSKLLEVDDLNNDTMMAVDTVRITMSGSRKKIGYILDCSTNISQVYGWKKEFLTKQPILTIMPPYYQQKHDKFLLNHYNTGKTHLLNNTSVLPVMGSDGYLRPSRVHIKMHPFVERGISYVAVLRVIKEPKRMVLIRRDGTIDAMSKNFAIDMNIISRDNSDIFSFCPEFKPVNSAFNKKTITIISENSTRSKTRSTSLKDNFLGKIPSDEDDFINDQENPTSFHNYLTSKHERSLTDTIEAQTQAIYDTFQIGSKLAFYPQRNQVIDGDKIKLFSKSNPDTTKPVFYNVQIVTRIHDKDFIKILCLDRITNEDDAPSFEKKNQEKRALMTSGRVTNSNRPLISLREKKTESICKMNINNIEESERITIPDEFDDIKIHIIQENYSDPLAIQQNQTNNFAPRISQAIINQTSKLQKFTSLPQNSKIEPLQEENFFRKKLQKLKEKSYHADRADGSLTGSTLSRGKKVQGLVVKALETRKNTKPATLFSIGFLAFNFIVLVLQVSECATIVGLVENIQSKTLVMANGAFRLNSFLSLGMYARSYLQAMQDESLKNMSSYVSNSIASMYAIYAKEVHEENTQLRQQVSEVDSKYQKEFYKENIRMYDIEKTLIGYYSNFDAAGLLIDHSIRFLRDQVASNYSSTDFDDVEFVLTNIYNDFLVSSESVAELLILDLDDTLSFADKEISILYGLSLATALLFFILVLGYLYRQNQNSNRFANLFFRLNLQEAQETKFLLGQFIRSLEGHVHDLEDLHEKYTLEKTVKNKALASAPGKVRFRRPSMVKLQKKQALVFLRLLPIFVIIVIWTLNYFLTTKDVLSIINQQQTQIRYSLMKLYQQNLLIIEFIELVCTNLGATLRNVPVSQSFPIHLLDLKDVSEFIDHFRDSKGELSADEQAVFFSFPCQNFADYGLERPQTLVTACLGLSYGMEETSFTKINAQLYSSLTDYYYQFMESDRTDSDIKQVFLNIAEGFLPLSMVVPSMCRILYKTTIEDFESETHDARLNAIYFSVLTVFGIGHSAILVWFFVIRKILHMEAYYKMILKLVPIRLILGNQHLKHYLIQNSNNVLDNVRSFL